MIGDFNSADGETEEGSNVEQTSSWEQTHPFSHDDSSSVDGFASDMQGEAEQDGAEVAPPASDAYGWDHEYPEESRTSHWTNDVEGDHTELIKDSAIESAMESTPIEDATEPPSIGEIPTPEDQVAAEQVAEPEQQVAPEPEAEEEDSIEAYMNRLLNRVQGTPSSDASPTQSTPLVESDEAEEKTYDTNKATTDVGATMPPIEPDAPLVPRSQAPERNSDLSAMRELANSSARSAVARSVRIQARDTQMKAMMKFGQAAIAGGCAVACFTLLNWSLVVRMVMVGAILVIAGILVQEGLVLLSEARRRLKSAENGDHERAEEIAGSDESQDSPAVTDDSSDADTEQ